MVEGLRLWAREIIIVVFLAGALEMILPETDVKRFARVALGFFIVLAVGRPILGLFGGGLLFDQNLTDLGSWGLGTRSTGGVQGGGDEALERGLALRQASRDRVLAATRAALESQFAALAARDPDVAEAEAEVVLVTDPSSPNYGNLEAVKLKVWMAPEKAGENRGDGSQGATGTVGGDSGRDTGGGTGGAGSSDAGGPVVAPVIINVQPIIVTDRGERSGGGGTGRPGAGAAVQPIAIESDTSDGAGAGTRAGELARRLRSEIVLLFGVPPGGITVEVWPAAG